MQQTDLGLNFSTKKTRKREFLEQMQQLVPLKDLVALNTPDAPEGRKGRPSFPVEMLLRIHFMQQWFTHQRCHHARSAARYATVSGLLDLLKPIPALQEQLEQAKPSIRAIIKRQFGHVKTRYRCLKKNTQQLLTLFALAN